MSSDASLWGWGLTGKHWPVAQVKAVGRVTERSRFRLMPGTSARDHAIISSKLLELNEE